MELSAEAGRSKLDKKDSLVPDPNAIPFDLIHQVPECG